MTSGTHSDWVADSLSRLSARLPELITSWADPRKPFRYIVDDEFLPPAFAEAIHESYPPPDLEGWDNITYTHQRKKFVKESDFPPAISSFFELSANPDFLSNIERITGIQRVLADPALVGGGLHQVARGGFLDVHVDFNFHPNKKLHRRLNLLLYMNKDWLPEYGGQLELWDMQAKKRVEDLTPAFNRAVLFETTEHSFHGHPRPVASPPHITRKSLAVYYFSEEREKEAIAPEHNTLYRQTTGLAGYVKTARSTLEATTERLREVGITGLAEQLATRVLDRAMGRQRKNG